MTFQILNVEQPSRDSKYKLPNKFFANWLAGFTDGDGCFYFNKREGFHGSCSFVISQATFNLKSLYHIKKQLGYGKIYIGKNMSEFRIGDRKTLVNLIVPLFIQYPLYSTKQFDFLRWVKALEILEGALPYAEKDKILKELRLEKPITSPPYVSPSWEKEKPTDEWIAGFVEAEGSFYLTKRGNNIVNGFSVGQKLDRVILEFLQERFHIAAKVYTSKKGVSLLQTMDSRSLSMIRDFFWGKLKGNKKLEFAIWRRSFKLKGNRDKLLRAQDQMRNLRRNPNTAAK